MSRFIGALDQGTTSTRFMVFDAAGREVAKRQREHKQILPRAGWVEHDPIEIAARVDEVIAGVGRRDWLVACEDVGRSDLRPRRAIRLRLTGGVTKTTISPQQDGPLDTAMQQKR